MKLFISSLNSKNTGGGIETSPVIDVLDYYSLPTFKVILAGQSLAYGSDGLDISGYSAEKMNQPNARWLNTRGFLGDGYTLPSIQTVPVLQQFSPDIMTPYQLYDYGNDLPTYGACLQFDLAEKLWQDNGVRMDLLQLAWGAQPFINKNGTNGRWYMSADGLTQGVCASGLIDTMQIMKNVYDYDYDCVLWLHGESDARDSYASLIAYEQNLTNFITQVRLQSGNTNLPFFIRKMPENARPWIEDNRLVLGEYIGGTVGGLDIINQSFANVAAAMTNVFVVEMYEPSSLKVEGPPAIHTTSPLGNAEMTDKFYTALDNYFNF